MPAQNKFLNTTESRVGTFVIVALIIAAGCLIGRYLQTRAADDTSSPVETSAQEESAAALSASAIEESEDLLKAEESNFYIVKKGDSLWKIAAAYLGSGSAWKELARVNNIPIDNPRLEVGQKLVVSGFGGPENADSAESGADDAEVSADNAEKDADGADTETGDVLSALSAEKTAEGLKVTESYTVQKGDTLWGIAEKFYGDGSQWQKLFDAPENNLSMYTASNGVTYPLLHAGNVLIIPAL